jgi:hypothetical protein
MESPMRVMCSLLAAVALTQVLVLAQAQAQSATPAASSAPAKPSPQSTHKTTPPVARGKMDLKAPALDRIYPRSELQYILAEESDADSAQEVSVKGAKYSTPVPAGQLQAIPWALMHPTQAWRVFTPLEQP